MPGPILLERDGQSNRQNIAESIPTPLDEFTKLGEIHALTDDDKYSDAPERRRLYWIYGAATEVKYRFETASARLTSMPVNCRAALQTGDLVTATPPIVYFSSLPSFMAPAYRESISTLVAEIQDIMREKGFRFSPSLMTSREHQEVGSSGYADYGKINPDIPIPILRSRLRAEGKIRPEDEERGDNIYTVEETDKARRLMGRTRLDLETGKVTNEIDGKAKNDSYIFLSPQRRVEVMEREAEIIAAVETIAVSAAQNLQQLPIIVSALDAYSKGEITSPELEMVIATAQNTLGEEDGINIGNNIQELKRLAFETGRWDRILTPQEILLRTGGSVADRYLARPYTPISIQDGESAELIAQLRAGEANMVITTELPGHAYPYSFRLEQLDASGNTVKSPTFIDPQDPTKIIEEDVRSFCTTVNIRFDFPFARPDDWYSKA